MSRPGKWWCIFALTMIAYGFVKGINLLALLGYFMIVVAVLNLLFAGRRLTALTARRHRHEPAFAGEPCLVEIAVTANRHVQMGVSLLD
ncbi:MAG: hypothetical protein ACRD36_08300, partial [Candidatus Acidiferrum sp.]